MNEANSPVQGVRWKGRTVVVDVVGDIDLHRSPQFQDSLLRLLDDKPERIVVNLSGVAYMDSSGIASLVKLLSRVRRSGAGMCLVGLNDRTRSLLEITRLDSVFDIHTTEEEALSS